MTSHVRLRHKQSKECKRISKWVGGEVKYSLSRRLLCEREDDFGGNR